MRVPRALLASTVVALACQADEPLRPTAEQPSFAISDGAHGGTGGFYFLPPMAPVPVYGGTFDPTVVDHVTVEICEWNGSDCTGSSRASFTTRSGTEGERIRLDDVEEHYSVNWRAPAASHNAMRFRLTVSVGPVPVGFADLVVVARLTESRDDNDAIVVVGGRTFPIKFRLEKGIPGYATLGSEGGRFTSSDGRVDITVPSGALNQQVTIFVTPAARSLPVDLPVRALGTGYTFSPDGLVSSQPIGVVWHYDEVQIPGGFAHSDLRMLQWSETFKTITPLIGVNDLDARTLTYEVIHFSEQIPYVSKVPWNYTWFRWTTRSLRWYLEPATVSFLTPSRVQASFDQWQAAGNGAIRFEQTGQLNDAHIIVRESFDNCPEYSPDSFLGGLLTMGVACVARDKTTLGDDDTASVRISSSRVFFNANLLALPPNDVAFAVIRHEIGHALGIHHPSVEAPFDAPPVMEQGAFVRPNLHLWDVSALQELYPSAALAGGPPRTGQTVSYGAGDDGALQRGIAWPVPRFTDHGNGTITDLLTGLIWTKDANLAGPGTWQAALQFVADLNAGRRPNLGHTDWRLPNIRELLSLVDYSTSGLPVGHPFVNLPPNFSFYWSSTTARANRDYAWSLFNGGGGLQAYHKSEDFPPHFHLMYAWPVRGGQGGAAAVPRTGQTTVYVAGDDGSLQRGVAWPSPRFTDIGDGTVLDRLTGLIWTKDANLAGTNKTWNQALAFVIDMNAERLPNYGYTDWRLPNVLELESMVDYQQSLGVLPSDNPFSNVQFNFYWSSTTDTYAPIGAWLVNLGDASLGSGTKDGAPFGQGVWPVRNAAP